MNLRVEERREVTLRLFGSAATTPALDSDGAGVLARWEEMKEGMRAATRTSRAVSETVSNAKFDLMTIASTKSQSSLSANANVAVTHSSLLRVHQSSRDQISIRKYTLKLETVMF